MHATPTNAGANTCNVASDVTEKRLLLSDGRSRILADRGNHKACARNVKMDHERDTLAYVKTALFAFADE